MTRLLHSLIPRPLTTQVIEVAETPEGHHYWKSNVVGFVPHDTIEMQAKAFSVGTKVIVKYAEETVQQVGDK